MDLMGSGHSTKHVRVQGASGWGSHSYGLVLGSPARNQEMDLILKGRFHLERFCDNTNTLLIQTAAEVFGKAQIVL